MINTYYGTAILDAFFHTSYHDTGKTDDTKNAITSAQLKDNNNNIVQFPKEPYIALFTDMPDASGADYKEPTSTYYNRVSLVKKGPANLQTMSKATTENGTGEYAGKEVAVIKNQDIIVFREVEDDIGYSKNVVGFGVFDTPDKDTGTLMLWGELTSAATGGTPIGGHEIPVFRIGEFIFKLA